MMETPIEIGLPEKMSIHQDGLFLVIVRRWFGAATVYLTAFSVFWDAFLVFWYAGAPLTPTSVGFWFPLLHVAVGIYITYTAICGWVNRTYVRAGPGALTVRTRPLPWFDSRSLESSAIKQLYSKEHVRSTRNGSVVYEVHAILRNGRNIKLVGGLESSEQAVFLEQKIEKRLGIENAPVRGEI